MNGGFQSLRLGFALRDDGTVAVLSRLSDGRRGIWVEEDGALRKVVLEGEVAPGFGGGITFTDIPTLHAGNRREVVFAAGVVGFGQHGVWAGTPDEIRLVVRPGDSIDVHGETSTIDCVMLANSPFGCFAFAFASGATGTAAGGFPIVFNDRGDTLFHVLLREDDRFALVMASEPRPELDLKLKALGRPEVGAYFSIGYEVKNVGTRRATNVSLEVSTFDAEISFSSSLKCGLSEDVLQSKAVCGLPDLEPDESTDVWIIAHGNSEGTAALFADVTSDGASAELDLELNVLTRWPAMARASGSVQPGSTYTSMASGSRMISRRGLPRATTPSRFATPRHTSTSPTPRIPTARPRLPPSWWTWVRRPTIPSHFRSKRSCS